MSWIYLLISAVVVLADQGLKNYIAGNFALGEVHNVIPNVLSLTYLQNNGAAGNILSGKMWLFYLISFIVIPIVICFIFSKKYNHWFFNLGLALVLGGIIGNLVDRLHLKYVIDMFQLDFMNFNIFNVADAGISVGIAILFIYLIFIDREEKWKN